MSEPDYILALNYLMTKGKDEATKEELDAAIEEMKQMREEHKRVVYGARCVWWGSITDTHVPDDGIPRCPLCGGVLFEMDNEQQFMKGASNYEDEGHQGYVLFTIWLKGRCFRTIQLAAAAYMVESGQASPL